MSDDLDISLRQRGDADVELRRGADRLTAREPAILHGSDRIQIPAGGLLIGRDAGCDLRLTSGLVAPKHARVTTEGRGGRVTDLGSRTGVYVNGDHFTNGSRALRSGDSIAVGDEILYYVATRDPALPPVELPPPHSALRMDRPRLVLGRDPSCDVVLDHPTVSPSHAEIAVGPSGARIKDLSRGGTGVRVNGRLVSRGFLRTGAEIAIGPFRLVFDGELLQQRAADSGLRLDAEGVRFEVGEKTILQPSSLSVLPGELVAIIGPSGAGKSTLMKVMCGVHRASAGRVIVDGEPVGTRSGDLGYVPQDEIVHPLLTVREALAYAAELRLPLDVRAEDRTAAVARVMEEVGLTPHGDTRIANLSGGQRKRAGVATELISQPGLLFLDEPTTGLDPGLEQRLMLLFRGLAAKGRGTVVVTHATRSLRLCDKVVVMGEGGFLCFIGPPREALRFFAVEHFDDLYAALEERGAPAWSDHFQQTGPQRVENVLPSAGERRLRPRPPLVPQAATLVRRRVCLLARDGRNLWILGLQVPILAMLTAALFNSSVFVHGGEGDTRSAGLSAQLLFLMVTVALWFGALASAREIVKERAVVQRETAVGVGLEAYIASKGTVLFALTGAQTLVFAAIVFVLRPLHEPSATAALTVLILVLTSWVGVGMGLLVSVAVRTEDQAASFIPLVLIPQLLFGGSVMPVHQMGTALKIFSKIVPAQWAFAGVGSSIDLNRRIAQDPVFRTVSRYGHSFFALPPTAAIAALVAFLVVIVTVLRKRLPKFLAA